jgi:hypothetical protein
MNMEEVMCKDKLQSAFNMFDLVNFSLFKGKTRMEMGILQLMKLKQSLVEVGKMMEYGNK